MNLGKATMPVRYMTPQDKGFILNKKAIEDCKKLIKENNVTMPKIQNARFQVYIERSEYKYLQMLKNM
jgi:hypothetical protein